MITLTPRAASEVQAAQAQRAAQGFGLRIQLVGGGCEGFLYDLAFEERAHPDDWIFESEGVKVFVDAKSCGALDGLVIDHRATRYGKGFVFDNPRAKKHCSC